MTTYEAPPLIQSIESARGPIFSFPSIDNTTVIVAAYVSHNAVSTSELPDFIKRVHSAVTDLLKPQMPAPEPEPLVPAVPVKKSITPDAIICLEDGLPFKSLKRHLHTQFKMTPEQYRAKWGLPADYPMVAPNYSAARSNLAKKSGLGTKAVSHR